MKKYALIISLTVLSLLFSQCKKEVITENGTSPVNGTFTLTANIDNGGSKTDITAAGAVTWKTNDKIYVVSKTTGVLGFVECTEDGTTFTGNITVGNGEECYFYFLGSSRTDVANGTASINIEEFATQAGTLADITQNHHLMKGVGTVSNNSATVTMTSMISIAYFDISGFKGETVKLYGTNIYKGMTLNLTAGTFATANYSASDETSAITIGGTGTEGAYVAFVPTNQATLTFKGTGTDDYTETMAGPYKFSENRFYTQNGGPIVVKSIALPGVFSVSAGKTVRFSQGNLTYTPNPGTWTFHENQWDVCEGNVTTTRYVENGTLPIDLFGWGTSGQSTTGAECWKPWSTSTNNPDYYPGGAYTNNLTYENKADWGYNAISNGGNTTEKWRTLTKDEWVYLIGKSASSYRTDALSKRGGATITLANSTTVTGLVVLPDVWTKPEGITEDFLSSSSYTSNQYTVDKWSLMESAGAVFLPAAGYRDGSSVSDVGTYGSCWSSSYVNKYSAYSVGFNSDDVSPSYGNSRCYGRSVRLVADY